jgi:phosphate transport system protein
MIDASASILGTVQLTFICRRPNVHRALAELPVGLPNGDMNCRSLGHGWREFQGKDAYVRKVFQEELTQVGEQLVEISRLVSEAIGKATTSFQVADVDLAQDVIAADARIDFLQNSLDERAIDILALQGPVASDLRMLVGSLRMSASLERMGDLARHIAQLARLRFPSTVIPAGMTETFNKMAELDQQIADKLTELLETRDLEVARDILKANTAINDLHLSVFNAIARSDWQESPATTVDVALASRYFERFADHGVSVAQKVTYLVTGAWQPNGIEHS